MIYQLKLGLVPALVVETTLKVATSPGHLDAGPTMETVDFEFINETTMVLDSAVAGEMQEPLLTITKALTTSAIFRAVGVNTEVFPGETSLETIIPLIRQPMVGLIPVFTAVATKVPGRTGQCSDGPWIFNEGVTGSVTMNDTVGFPSPTLPEHV